MDYYLPDATWYFYELMRSGAYEGRAGLAVNVAGQKHGVPPFVLANELKRMADERRANRRNSFHRNKK